jgi:hypothetical protein
MLRLRYAYVRTYFFFLLLTYGLLHILRYAAAHLATPQLISFLLTNPQLIFGYLLTFATPQFYLLTAVFTYKPAALRSNRSLYNYIYKVD